ncbi:MAG: glycoside hydrolase family 31 protein [Deltaproteobacteria bacterium]|nr:glycoside hydrolase family 31 protein [Deltaproteobacteria bacterium]
MRRVPLLFLCAVALACAEDRCPGDVVDGRTVTSGATTARVTLERFGVTVLDGAMHEGTTASEHPQCAPLALALRADDDVDAWHRPTAPRGDELWLRSAEATVLAEDPLTLEVTLRGDAGRTRTATVVITAGAEGFIDLDVQVNEDELNVAYVATCFELAAEEHAVGGGERFDGPDLRGKVVPLVFEAPGEFASSTNEAHAPVPFYASSRGLGLLVESERVGAFDVGVTVPHAMIARFHGTSLPLRVRAGGIVDNVAAHARRMVLPPPPPLWALAPMQWRNDLEVTLDAGGAVTRSGTDMLLADVAELRGRGLPFSTVWIDAPWQTGYNTLVFNEGQLPGIDAAIADLEAQGLRVLTWATEHLNTTDDSGQAYGMPAYASRPLFDAFAAAGHLVTDEDGDPFQFPWGRGAGGFVDFTNPDACAAFQAQMVPLFARGVHGFKLDYGETMRADLLGRFANVVPHFSDGSTTAVQHVRYARLYHECYLSALRAAHGEDAFIITRTGGIHDQRNGVAIWPGDLDSGFERAGQEIDGERAVGGIPAAVAGFLSLQMSGYPLYGADVGGYRGGTPTTEAWLRWAQAGALSTVMQVGGGGNQAPWDPELVDVIDAFAIAARLHVDLWPMWQSWLARAASDGTPVAVPVGVVVDAPEAWADVASYVIGEALLAAPVIDEGARERALYLPPGRWRSWWDGSVIEGPGLVVVDAPLDLVPLFVEDNAMLVLGHPRLVTLLDNGATPGGYDDLGAARVVRATAGDARTVTVGDLTVERAAGDALDLTLTSATSRPLVVDAWPAPGANVTVDGAAPATVADEDALLACTSPCVLVEGQRVRVAFSGASAHVVVAP